MSENNTIRVYRLIDPSIIYLNADKIAYYFFGMPQLQVKDKKFSVDTNTGFFTYTDYSQLFTNYQKQKLPKNKNEAQKAADSFMVRANALVQNEPFFTKQGFPKLFSNLKFSNAKSVGHPERYWIDHWVVSYKGDVKPSSSEKSVQVSDSIVEFKIGNLGQVIACVYHWSAINNSEEHERSMIADKIKGCIYFINSSKNTLQPYFITD